MTPLDPTDGPAFRPGDRLTAADLTEWQGTPVFRLSRHFRALHGLYGVADGAAVRLTSGDLPGEWKLTVEPGTAFDAIGRPLRLTHAHEMTLFALGGTGAEAERNWTLLGSTPADAVPLRAEPYLVVLRGEEPERGQLGVQQPGPPCPARVVLIPRSEPLSPWDIPLAGLRRPREGRRRPTLDVGARANAVRGFRRPYLATGTLPAGTTAVGNGKGSGWRVWVDTRVAGFLPVPAGRPGLAPVYLVTVGRQTAGDTARFLTGRLVVDPALGDRVAGIKPRPGAPVPPVTDRLPRTAGPAVTLSEVRPDGFLVTVEYPGAIDDLKQLKATPLVVHWIGVEQRHAGRERDKPIRTEGVTVRQSNDRPPLAWPTFQDGQRLSPDDLNDVKQTVRELQWLHNRTLHDWGVAEGYEVTAFPNKRGVRVQRGTAVDVKGRELLLNDPVELSLPPQPPQSGPDEGTEWWVTATYRDSPAPRDGDPACRLDGVPLRRLPQAAVRWRDPQAVEIGTRLEPGLDVILATVKVVRGEVVEVSAVGRRSAVPPRRPYVAAGRTPRNPEWGFWPDGDPKGPIEGIWFPVDTTAGGFVSTPHYLLQLERLEPRGDRPPLSRPEEEEAKLLEGIVGAIRPTRFFVADATATGFRVVVLFDAPISPAEPPGWLERLLGRDKRLYPEKLRAFVDASDLGSDAERELRRKWKQWATVSFLWRFAWVGIEV